MKKALYILMAALLVISMSAGCSNSAGSKDNVNAKEEADNSDEKESADEKEEAKETGETVELVMAWWGNQVRNDRTATILEMYMDQNPNVVIEGQFNEWADYWPKLSTASTADNLPDIIQHDYSKLNQYVESDLLIDLTPYIESGLLEVSGIDEGLMQSGTINGGIYAIPWTINAPAMLYNKTLLDELGIEIHDNMTMDEFIEIARKVYAVNGTMTDMGFRSGLTNIDYMLRGFGINMFDGDKFGATAEDLAYFYQLHEDGIKEGWQLDPTVFAERTSANEQVPLVFGNIPDGRSWCHFGYSNQLTAMGRIAKEEGWEIGITSIPSVNPQLSNYLKPSMFISVSSDTKNPEEAVKVLNYIMNDVACNEVLLCERGVPAVGTVSDAIIPKLEELDVQAIEYINNVVSLNCSPISPANPAKADEVTNLINTLDEEVCYGAISAVDAGQKLFEEGNRMLAE